MSVRSEQYRRDTERNQRLSIFNSCISRLDPRRNAQELVNEIVAGMTTSQREQLKNDIEGLDMYNCFTGHYSLQPFIDRALTHYGLGVFSKLILPDMCPDCGFEWDNHSINCPQLDNNPRASKLVPAHHAFPNKRRRPRSRKEVNRC